MYELIMKNVFDILVITFLFCFSIKTSCLININSKLKFILFAVLTYITLFFIPFFTQIGSFLIIFLELILIIYWDNHILKNQFINITYAYLITITSALLSEALVVIIIFIQLHLDVNNPLHYCIYLISHISIDILINTIINIFIKKYYTNLNIKNIKDVKKNDYLVISNMILSISITSLIITIYNYPDLKWPIIISTIVVCTIIVINQLIYSNFYNDKIKSSKLNEELLNYNESLEKNADEIVSFKHDMKNMLFTLADLVDKSNNSSLKEFYFNKIFPISNNALQKETVYKKLKHIENIYLKSFLYYKLCEIIENNISVNIEIDGNFKETKIDIIEIVRIIGILLDNASEEASKLACGNIKIKFIQNSKGEEYIIQNTLKEYIDISMLKNGYTTKGENHGNGLLIINNIIKKYSYVNLNTYIKSNYFFQDLTIFYK